MSVELTAFIGGFLLGVALTGILLASAFTGGRKNV